MNKHTSTTLRRLILATSNPGSFDRTRFRRLKKDWTRTPWNQRGKLLDALNEGAEAVAESRASQTVGDTAAYALAPADGA